MTRDPVTNDYAAIEKLEERCTLCNQEWVSSRWCRGCYSEAFKAEFPNWTSGNAEVDAFIRETQMTAEFPEQVLEWIPESHLTEITKIGKGGYGTVFKSYRQEGRIYKRDFDKNEWKRKEPSWVAMKHVDEKEGNVVELLKEVNNKYNPLKLLVNLFII